MSETLLPPNATDVERAMDGATSSISFVPVLARETANPDDAPASTLPWLAWGVSVDEWNSAWSDEQKRATIKSSLTVHKYKGTIGAVREALGALGYAVEVQEWFNQTPQAAPYTFRLKVTSDQGSISLDDWERLLLVVNNAKNLRSHLDGIDLEIVSQATPTLAGVLMMGSEIEIEAAGGNLKLDGSWTLDGTWILNGLKITV